MREIRIAQVLSSMMEVLQEARTEIHRIASAPRHFIAKSEAWGMQNSLRSLVEKLDARIYEAQVSNYSLTIGDIRDNVRRIQALSTLTDEQVGIGYQIDKRTHIAEVRARVQSLVDSMPLHEAYSRREFTLHEVCMLLSEIDSPGRQHQGRGGSTERDAEAIRLET
jgi:hypothetical protein